MILSKNVRTFSVCSLSQISGCILFTTHTCSVTGRFITYWGGGGGGGGGCMGGGSQTEKIFTP